MGVPIPSSIAAAALAAGQTFVADDLLFTLEAMKLEINPRADRAATEKVFHFHPGLQVEANDLLLEFTEQSVGSIETVLPGCQSSPGLVWYSSPTSYLESEKSAFFWF